MTQESDIHKEWVQALKDEGRELTSWEEGFVSSIDDKLDRGVQLSDREIEILERIYADKTP